MCEAKDVLTDVISVIISQSVQMYQMTPVYILSLHVMRQLHLSNAGEKDEPLRDETHSTKK